MNHSRIYLQLTLCVTFFIFVSSQDVCSGISNDQRLDCYPESYATQEKCLSRKCCWRQPDEGPEDVYVPSCFYPNNYPTYKVDSETPTERGTKYLISKSQPVNLYSGEFKNAQLELINETKNRLRLRFTSLSENRWEPPVPTGPPEKNNFTPTYKVKVERQPLGLTIYRGDKVLLEMTDYMSTALTLSDQFLQISWKLFADKGYGLGERRISFPISLDKWIRAAMWNRDQAPIQSTNLYGSHNFFMSLDANGDSFGIFLLNSNAQEVAIQPLPALTYRSIGGILDFFILTGPKPMDVIQQYYELIGRPPLPPYWSLGFQLCRYGYKNTEDVRTILNRNLDRGVPIDVQWVDIDYMNVERDWTLDPINFRNYGLFVENEIHQRHGMKAVMIVDPAIIIEKGYPPYEEGLKKGIFINDSRTGKPLIGSVWPGDTHFPDFSHPNVQEWWSSFAKKFHGKVSFDGLWIDMNEPSNFYDGSKTGCDDNSLLDNPPYVPPVIGGTLYGKTACPSATHYNNTHYNLHNLYSYMEAKVCRQSLLDISPDKRPFLLTRSSFAGSGMYTIHWTGDNFATWSDLKTSIAQIINFNVFAIPMIGVDICGFNLDTNEELCVRWHQLGAFYPFSRNHNMKGAIAQDPAAFSESATFIIRDALKLRYQLLPYLYALFYEAHLYGNPVARALSFEYPADVSTHFIDEQFMLGSCLLVNPVLQPGVDEVTPYVPVGGWFNMITFKRFESIGSFYQFSAPIHYIPVLLKAGCAVPMQRFAANTKLARKYGLQLFVVLKEVDSGATSPPSGVQSSGTLYWDDGETLNQSYLKVNFTVQDRTLTSSPSTSASGKTTMYNSKIDVIYIQGIKKRPVSVLFNEKSVEFTFLDQNDLILVYSPKDETFEDKFSVKWTF